MILCKKNSERFCRRSSRQPCLIGITGWVSRISRRFSQINKYLNGVELINNARRIEEVRRSPAARAWDQSLVEPDPDYKEGARPKKENNAY